MRHATRHATTCGAARCAGALLLALLIARPAAADAGAEPQAIDWGEAWEAEQAAAAAEQPDLADRDPLEPVNRKVFGFNRGVDWLILDPLSDAYGFVVPDVGKRMLRGVFRNLNEPVVFVNDLLQLEFERAATTFARVSVNTTVGIAGAWDPALRIGLARHHSDFGQTLARYWIPSGPYLVIPMLGPSTVRDFVGDLVDRLFRPQTYLLGVGPQVLLRTGDGISLREEYGDVLDELRSNSVDYYATMRSLYLVNREVELRGGSPLSDEDYERILAFGF